MRSTILMTTLIVFILGFAFYIPDSVSAAEDLDMEELLEGFDDPDAETGEDTDELLEGFDDETPSTESSITEQKDSPFAIDGYTKFGVTYNYEHDAPETGETDWRGFSRLRAELTLELKTTISDNWQAQISGKGFYDFLYGLRGHDEFTDEVVANYESELELGETYVIGSLLPSLDIKVGRQIVVWGKSDTIRITDVLNPLNFREPGLTDIEDLRLPVTMTRFDYYFNQWSITGIGVHEIRFNKTPVPGS
jgi:hypothetical protein